MNETTTWIRENKLDFLLIDEFFDSKLTVENLAVMNEKDVIALSKMWNMSDDQLKQLKNALKQLNTEKSKQNESVEEKKGRWGGFLAVLSTIGRPLATLVQAAYVPTVKDESKRWRKKEDRHVEVKEIKFVLIGTSGVGKSTIVRKYVGWDESGNERESGDIGIGDDEEKGQRKSQTQSEGETSNEAKSDENTNKKILEISDKEGKVTKTETQAIANDDKDNGNGYVELKTRDTFEDEYDCDVPERDIGCNVSFVDLNLSNGSQARLKICDAPNSNIFNKSGFWDGAGCVMIIYDICNKKSFDSIEETFQQILKDRCVGNPYFIMIGNKLDLKDKRQVEEKEGETYAKQYGWGFHEISATSVYQIDTLFKTCADYSYNKKIQLLRDQRNKKLQKHKPRDNEAVNDRIKRNAKYSLSLANRTPMLVPNNRK